MTTTRTSDERMVAAWHTIVGGATRVQARIDDRLEQRGVPPVWFPVLHLLLHADDHRLPMSVLARDVSMTSGGFTKLADRMARDGVIDRRGSSTDRRVVNARLTEHGVELAQRAVVVHRDALHEFVRDVIDDEELDVAARVLGLLSAHTAPGALPERMSEQVLTPPDPAQPDRRGRGRGNEGD